MIKASGTVNVLECALMEIASGRCYVYKEIQFKVLGACPSLIYILYIFFANTYMICHCSRSSTKYVTRKPISLIHFSETVLSL